ncbi:general transcription factor II-I repeat domain-containing protein 2-like [Ceratina calcarata]|uniref:General transcription factor II-I repeat domain-containing protein 2-like n=1 Tax=Ceratina calcarata TaxID=156304 RepID=A0AAJ7JBK5_9HYME|nr:general transcription factor II-I repeat domain-containing protein 2-like [Ceratina calcarata]
MANFVGDSASATSATSSTKAAQRVKKRNFNPMWKEEYFFEESGQNARCIICKKELLDLKKTNIKRHFDNMHGQQYGQLTSDERQQKLKELQGEYPSTPNETAIRYSYLIALEIAKSGHCFPDGKFVKKVFNIVSNGMRSKEADLLKNISLSRRTIARRIQEMGQNLHQEIVKKSNNLIKFSICLDESTDVKGTSQLAIFIRGVNEDLEITEELLDFCSMHGTTTGEDIFSCVEATIDINGLDWSKLISVTTDGAPAMVGKYIGVLAYVKRKMANLHITNDVTTIHCGIHQENLCAKKMNTDMLRV